MTNIEFYKYQATGNDFILIDARDQSFTWNKEIIAAMCDRKFGIGSDGLMMLENDADTDFYMKYFNPDGTQEAMCGNGSRCINLFASHLAISEKELTFNALDGIHQATIENIIDYRTALVKVKLIDVEEIKKENDNRYFLNTGVNHVVIFKENIDEIDIINEGAEVRYAQQYIPVGGTNANFVEIVSENRIKIRTYERGVENETLACGTGATASAIATAVKLGLKGNNITVEAKGGELNIFFELIENGAVKVYLQGEAKMVFKGVISI